MWVKFPGQIAARTSREVKSAAVEEPDRAAQGAILVRSASHVVLPCERFARLLRCVTSLRAQVM
jgi:hypothetical protein